MLITEMLWIHNGSTEADGVMSAIKLKVCGITSYEDACAAIDCGADYLGFNFYRKSPRYLAPETARAIITRLPPDIICVGVFVNEASPESVISLMQQSGVHLAQLHGDEDADYCAEVGADRVIRALRAGADFDPQQARRFPAAAILLDAYDKNLYGGTGKITNWEIARDVAKLTKVFLAGGLSPDNITDAILAVKPFAVDVNSGVERAPGRKDVNKLRALRQAMETC
jgi:phosphoribosylanthranilate isomerase